MVKENNYMDAEFVMSNSEKIDFKSILFKQIDYIRYLRTNDMGDYLLFDFGGNPKEEMFVQWIKNLSLYKNSVDSFKILIRSYHDDKFKKVLIKINTYYETKKNNAINKDLHNIIEKREIIKNLLLKKYSIIYTIRKYDSIFEECLMLIQRHKIIGGDNMAKGRE